MKPNKAARPDTTRYATNTVKGSPRHGQRYAIVDRGGQRYHRYGTTMVRVATPPVRQTGPVQRQPTTVDRGRNLSARSRGSAAVRRPARTGPAPTDPGNRLGLLSGPQFDQAVSTAGQAKYGPAIRQKESDIRGSRAQEARVGSWWDQYNAAVRWANDQNVQGLRNAQGLNSQLTDASSALDASQRAAQGNQAAYQAQLSGGTPAADVGQRAQQASMVGRAMGDQAGRTLADSERAQRYSAGKALEAGTLSKIAAQQAERNRRLAMYQDLGGLKSERGAYQSEYAGTLRDKERQFLLEQIAYGDKQSQAAAQQALASQRLGLQQSTADWRARDQRYKNSLKKQAEGERQRHNRAMENRPTRSSGGGRSGGGGSRGKSSAPFTRTQYQSIETAARVWIPQLIKARPGASADQVINRLTTGKHKGIGGLSYQQAVGALRRWRRYGRQGAPTRDPLRPLF